MAGGYDGEIRIKTKIDNADVSSQILKLENRMEQAAQKAQKLESSMRELEKKKIPSDSYVALEKQFDVLVEKGKKLSESLKGTEKYVPAKQYVETEKALDSVSAKQDHLRKKMEAWVELGKKTNTTSYKKMQMDFATLGKEADLLIDKLKKMDENGQDKVLSEKWKIIKSQMAQTGAEASRVKAQMREMESSDTVYINPKNTEEYQKLAGQLRQTNQEMSVLAKRHDELLAKQQRMKDGLKQTSGLFKTMVSRLKGLALSLLVFNWISKAFNAMIKTFQTGIQNMAKHSSEFNARMSEMKSATSTLKASLGTFAAPIISLIVPAIAKLCGWLTMAVNAVNRFIAAVTGKSTWTKAKKQQVDYAKSLDSTAGAAKKAAGALASFDDLNVLQKNDSGSGGSGSSGADGAGYEEVPLTEKDFAWVDLVKEKIASILPIVVAIGAALLMWQITDFLTGLMDANLLLGTIVSVIAIVAGSVLAVTSYFHMWKDGVDWKGLIGYIVGVSLAVGGLYAVFNPVVAGITLITASIAGLILSLKDIYENGLNVQNTSLLLVSAFGLVAGTFMAFGGPAAFVVGAIIGIIAVVLLLSRRADEIKEKFLALWAEHLKPLTDSIVAGVEEIKQKFLEFWSTYVKPIITELGTKFDELMSNHIQPMAEQFIELLGSMIDAVKELWENIMVPFINWIIENILPVVVPIFETLTTGFMEFAGFIADIISGILQVFKGIIDFLVGVFTGDWEKALRGISDILSGRLKAIRGFIAADLAVIHTIIQTALDVIGGIVKVVCNGIHDFIAWICGVIDNSISAFLSRVNGSWSKTWNAMKEVTVKIFDGIWNVIKKIINAILGGIEGMANGVVSGVNRVIDALNSLHFDIPDWIPEIGGKSFGFSIQRMNEVRIPRLANGGITTGSTIANIGEAGREAILPLENNTGWMDELAAKLADKMPDYSGTGQIILTLDGKEVARGELPYIIAEQRRIGTTFG